MNNESELCVSGEDEEEAAVHAEGKLWTETSADLRAANTHKDTNTQRVWRVTRVIVIHISVQ